MTVIATYSDVFGGATGNLLFNERILLFTVIGACPIFSEARLCISFYRTIRSSYLPSLEPVPMLSGATTGNPLVVATCLN